MIKVIGKTVNIISLLSSEKELPLREIARRTELNKTTVGNILSTLKKSGWLSQNDKGEYQLSESFFDLSRHYICEVPINNILDSELKLLVSKINENAVFAKLQNGERRVLVRVDCEQTVMVNGKAVDHKNVYNTATGHMLVAYLSNKEREQLFAMIGKPREKEWPDAVENDSAFFAKIRQRGYEMTIKSELVGIAVPVFDCHGKILGTLGAYLPQYRFNDEKLKTILSQLKVTAKEIENKMP